MLVVRPWLLVAGCSLPDIVEQARVSTIRRTYHVTLVRQLASPNNQQPTTSNLTGLSGHPLPV
jgi:hypothetical protein